MDSFAVFLQDVDGGALDVDLADALRKLVGQVLATNKAGSMSFSVSVEPNGEGRVLVRTPAVSVKEPQVTRGSTVFFADERGNLSRRDPRQRSFEEMVSAKGGRE